MSCAASSNRNLPDFRGHRHALSDVALALPKQIARLFPLVRARTLFVPPTVSVVAESSRQRPVYESAPSAFLARFLTRRDSIWSADHALFPRLHGLIQIATIKPHSTAVRNTHDR